MCNEVSVVFHIGLNYNYHFIIKKLGDKFEGKLECLGENTWKCKYCNESAVTISYEKKLIHVVRFMASSWAILVCNLTDGIHKISCKDCNCFLEYESVKDNSMKYKAISKYKGYLRILSSFPIRITMNLIWC